jgi:hypothetical protein
MTRRSIKVNGADYPKIDRLPLFVELPAAVAAVSAIRRWWPGIGVSADHPLTDYFISKRRRGFRLSRVPVGQVVWGGAWVAGMVATFVFYPYFSLLIIGAFSVVERGLHTIIFKKTVGEIADPMDVLEEREAVKMEQLYLAPIRFANLLGASAAVYYRHWMRHAAGLVLLLVAVMAFFLFIIQYYVARHFAMYVRPLNIGTTIIFGSMAWIVCRPTFVMALGMRNTYAKLIEKTGRNNLQREGVLMQRLWVGLALTILFSFGFLYVIRFFWAWLVFVVAACVLQCWLAGGQLDDVIESNFVRYSSEGEQYYRELFKTKEEREKMW